MCCERRRVRRDMCDRRVVYSFFFFFCCVLRGFRRRLCVAEFHFRRLENERLHGGYKSAARLMPVCNRSTSRIGASCEGNMLAAALIVCTEHLRPAPATLPAAVAFVNRRHRSLLTRVVACEAEESSADAKLMATMEALRNKDASLARTLLADAREQYESQEGGPTEDQQQLLDLVSQRVDAAAIPGFGRQSPERPPVPSKEELQLKAESKERGEKLLMEAVSVFGNKADGERFGVALRLLEEAREAFRFAGSQVERERDYVMGNLYAVIRAEEERAQRVSKLVRMKKLLELTKLKRKAETLGIDPDAVEAVMSESEAPQAAEAVDEALGGAEPDLADDILEAWRREGVDADGKEVDDLERAIQDMEDTL
jgi:hypothetical protein